MKSTWRGDAHSSRRFGFPDADAPDRAVEVLAVDDEPVIRRLLARILTKQGYGVRTAENAETALAEATANPPDLFLLDIGLPGMDGLELCRRLRAHERTSTLPIILLTGHRAVDDIVAGLDAGADDFLGKPFEAAELFARMRSVLRLRRALLRMDVAQAAVAALANAVEAKDPSTEHHCQRLAVTAARIASQASVGQRELEVIVYGALLHDVGKIGVPEEILTKPSALTDDEFDIMRRHPEIGERICAPLSALGPVDRIVRHHHERWDGLGYPDGLAKAAIPLGSRIVGVVDAFDAMIHGRPYRAARSIDEVAKELRREAARQFDPDLVRLLLEDVRPAVVAV